MKLKAFCLHFFLISFLAFSLNVQAFEATTSDATLSPSTIFKSDPESCVSPRNNLGKMLKNNGFTQVSVKEKKNGFDYYEAGVSYPSYVKTFTKEGYTVRYKYAIYADDTRKDNVEFDWVEITFPSKSAMNKFLDSLKESIKHKGYNIYTYPGYPNWNCIGDDDSQLKEGMAWPYDQYLIKGNTVTFHETKGMCPHGSFGD